MSKKSLDSLIVFILVLAQVRIITLADLVLPQRHEDARRWVEGWWPAWSLDRLAHPEIDPVSMMLLVTAFGLLCLYILVDMMRDHWSEKATYRLKVSLIYGLIGLLVFGKTILLINLRHLRGPASYAHDGGVIQTEVTIDYFLNGLNPYVEDYVDTPMGEWGYNEYRTALFHYPYLPWTFIFSTPFYLLSQIILGWYDQRMVYLLLFALALWLTHRLVSDPNHRLMALAVMGLNPLLSLSTIFGQNDGFVLFWIILALWSLILAKKSSSQTRLSWSLSATSLGLACASKPTAWFIVPFWVLYLLADCWGERLIPKPDRWSQILLTFWRRAWFMPVITLSLLLPWFIWNPEAMYDDVWRWSAGQGETGYQIWGWGASNYVLAFGLIEDRFEYWPFIIPQAIIGLSLLLFLLWRQVKMNHLRTLLYGYFVFMIAFFYVSRFMQPNYLGYLLGFLTLAYFIPPETEQEQSHVNFR